jgi:hypothetical protein
MPGRVTESKSSAPSKRGWKRRPFVLLLFVLLTGVGLALWLTGGFEDEPLHKGKPISYWVDRACRTQDSGSLGELHAIGPAVVPYLVSKLQCKDWPRDAWINLRAKLPAPVRRFLPSCERGSEIRQRAVWCLYHLGNLGPHAKRAVPRLIQLLRTDAIERHLAIETLANIGPAASNALPTLCEMLRCPDRFAHTGTAKAIWAIGRDTNRVLQVLLEAAQRPSKMEALNAPGVLSEMGSAASPAVPVLLSILNDPSRDIDVRENIAWALGDIGLNEPAVISALLAGMEDPNPGVQQTCAFSLWRLDAKYAPKAASLVVRAVIRLAWTGLIPFAEQYHLDLLPAVPALREMQNSESPEVRNIANEALAAIVGIENTQPLGSDE